MLIYFLLNCLYLTHFKKFSGSNFNKQPRKIEIGIFFFKIRFKNIYKSSLVCRVNTATGCTEVTTLVF